MTVETKGIRSCWLCGHSGEIMYKNLEDNLFGMPGSWDITVCKNSKCGLGWMSSELPSAGISSLYEDYYTHGDDGREIKFEKSSLLVFLTEVLSILSKLLGLSHQRTESEHMYLKKKKPGRLLDIGCGDGSKLALFKELGWTVEGQETDPLAANRARAVSGATVHCGDIEGLNFPDKRYDAIILNHVLEHLLNPVEVLQICKRTLAPGGVIVVKLPNFSGYGHQAFGRFWRGLEPPRHLFHYGPCSLELLFRKAGLVRGRIFTSAANSEAFAVGSYLVRYGISAREEGKLTVLPRIRALIFQYFALLVFVFDRSSGDECVLIWTAEN